MGINGNSTKRRGRVARIVTDKDTGARKGFGFIVDDETNEEYFFHASDLVAGSGSFAAVTEGQRAVFGPTQTGKGLRAAHVEISG